jgi:hypothetical protein
MHAGMQLKATMAAKKKPIDEPDEKSRLATILSKARPARPPGVEHLGQTGWSAHARVPTFG